MDDRDTSTAGDADGKRQVVLREFAPPITRPICYVNNAFILGGFEVIGVFNHLGELICGFELDNPEGPMRYAEMAEWDIYTRH